MDLLPSQEVAHFPLMPRSDSASLSQAAAYDGDTNLIDFAMFLEMKSFLAQRHSLSLMEKICTLTACTLGQTQRRG